MTPALWSSGFRPFFLLGAAYGPIAIALSMFSWEGILDAGAGHFPVQTWHAHEMIFGFSATFICGFLLTALPSWAGTPEIKGGRLMLLVAVWAAGRVGAWSYSWWWPGIDGALDLLLFPLLAILLLPGLLRAPNKRYLAVLVILTAFIVANAIYYEAVWCDDARRAEDALLMALNVLVVLFSIVAGFLTPIFTENELRDNGQDAAIGFLPLLEAAAIASAILFAASAWPGVPAHLSGAIACIAAAIHLARLLRWRTLSILRTPLVLATHLGYAWLVVAMALRGLADAFDAVPPAAWLHAFTVGAFGMTSLALLNRVALRHTGRVLTISGTALAELGFMLAAGLLRVGVSVLSGSAEFMAIAAILWAIPCILFLATDGQKLWRPSLPRHGPVESPPGLFGN